MATSDLLYLFYDFYLNCSMKKSCAGVYRVMFVGPVQIGETSLHQS